ncbi:MAG TPA: OmpA family protein [Candidatus Polarisedimenticolia bacterium]|nr:OmpA family protein [Candidatus Polarisedimenticolia bacterium]
MSARFNLNTGPVVTGVLIVLPILLIWSRGSAQRDSNSKEDRFVGYQSPHPGSVPAPSVAPSAVCSVQPNEVTVGEPITATVSPNHFNPKHTLAYVWSPSNGGGKIIGKDASAQIETTNAAAGNYTVTARVTDVKSKKNNEASCSANFTVKLLPPKNPPHLSISALPLSIPAGGTVNLSAHCTSPDGVPVTISNWTSVGGAVSSTGGSAILDTARVSPGAIAVSATCTDSRGMNVQASTEVIVENPPPPAPKPEIEVTEARLSLHSIYFPTAMPRIRNPNAGLVASQQQTLVALAADFKRYLESRSEAHLILEGNADPRGRAEYDQKLSERRVERVKSFLVEQGVSATDIETKAFGALHVLSEDEVKVAFENDPQLSPEERQRALRNLRTIVLASDRRVDITLSTTGQSSVRHLPLNAEDALTLIGGRESVSKKKAKTAPKK